MTTLKWQELSPKERQNKCKKTLREAIKNSYKREYINVYFNNGHTRLVRDGITLSLNKNHAVLQLKAPHYLDEDINTRVNRMLNIFKNFNIKNLDK